MDKPLSRFCCWLFQDFAFLHPVPFIATPKCQILVKRKTSSPVKSQGKWLAEDLFSNVQVNWENTYQLPFLCTTETKLRVFQFKFLHRRVATNDFLLKIGKKETDSCSSCAGSPETLTHFFGIVDQLRVDGIMFRSGPPKILIWPTWTLPPFRPLFA